MMIGAAAVLMTMSFGSVGVVATSGGVLRPQQSDGHIMAGLAVDGLFDAAPFRLGLRAAAFGGRPLFRSGTVPLAGFDLNAVGQLRLWEGPSNALHVGLSAGYGAFSCVATGCAPAALRGGMEVEWGWRFQVGTELLIRAESSALISASPGWSTTASVGLRFGLPARIGRP